MRAFEPLALSDERRRQIAEALKRYFAQIDAQRNNGPADEVDAILDEAIRCAPQFSSASVRIVLDTTILVRATDKTHGPARDLLLIIVSGRRSEGSPAMYLCARGDPSARW